MATDLERLQVSLDADIKKFENAMNRALGITNKQLGAVQKKTETVSKQVGVSLGDIGKTFAIGLGAAGSLKGFQDLVDASTRVQNSLKVAGLSGADLTKVYDALFASAQKNAVPIESLVTLYGRMSLVQKDLGASTQDMLTFTDDVGKALRVAGTDAQTASGALLQLSQALGSGTVHSEEFNSVLEGALPILQAAALGIKDAGGSVSKLKQLVVNGQISSQELFRGFLAGAKILDERLKGSVLTVDQALVRMKNSLINAAGAINEVSGASQLAVGYISALGDYVDALSHVFEAASSGSLGKYVGWLEKLGDAAKKIPVINPLAGLPSADDLNKLADALTIKPIQKLQEARDQLAGLLNESVPRGGKHGATADEGKQVDALVAGLKDGSIIAQDFSAKIDALGPKFKKLADQLQPYVDKLKEAQAAVLYASPTAGFKLNIPDPTGAFADRNQKITKLFDQRDADSMRSDLQRDIDTRSKAIIDAAAKLGVVLSEAAAKIQAKAEITNEAAAKAVDSSISSYVSHVNKAEGTGNNPNSSASGIGQFIESTWISLFQKYFPDKAEGMTRAAILALRSDSATANTLIEAYARENAAILQKAGVSVDEAALQLAHFLGPQGAIKVLQAAPNTPVSQLLDQNAIKANPTILGNGATAGDVVAYAQRRAGMTTPGTQTLDSRDDFQKMLKEQQQQLTNLREEAGLRASLNPLVNDYGKSLTSLQKAQELFTESQKEGTAAGKELTSAQQLLTGDLSKLSPEAQKQALAMRSLATEYGNTEAASNRLKETQDELAKSQADALSLAKDVTGGVLSDIRSALEDGKITWKEWGQIAVNALNKIADKIQDTLLDQLFSNKTGGFSFLGSLFGGVGGTTGGSSAFGSAANPKLPQSAALSAVPKSMPSLPNMAAIKSQSAVPVAVDVRTFMDEDGNWQSRVEKIATGVSVRTGKAGLEQYRKGKFHSDWESHAGRRKVRGTSG